MTIAITTAEPEAAPTARWGYALSMAGTLVSRLATLAVLILLPRQIGLTEYGMFALVVTVGEIVEMTSSNWYRVILVRQSVNPVIGAHTGKGLSIGAILALCSLLAVALASGLAPLVVSQNDFEFAIAVSLYILAFVAFRLLVTLLQAQGSQRLIGAIELVRGVLTLGLVFAFVAFGPKSFAAASAGLIAATACAAMIGIPAVRGRGLELLRQRLEPGAFAAIGIPIVIATMLTYQLGWLDRLVIQHWLGPQTVGLYVAVIAVARQPIDLVLNSLNSQTFPVLLARGDDSSPEAGRRIAGILVAMCILGCGAAAAIVALQEPLLQFALPAFDQSVARLLTPLIAMGALALGVKHFVFDNIFHAHGRNWIMLRWFAVISFATLGLSLFAVPRFGAAGAAACLMRAAADVARGFDTGHAWHVHVEEADVGMMGVEQIHRFAAVACARDDLQFRPDLRELAFERLAQQRFVLGDQGGGNDRVHREFPDDTLTAAARAGNDSSAQTPRGVTSLS